MKRCLWLTLLFCLLVSVVVAQDRSARPESTVDRNHETSVGDNAVSAADVSDMTDVVTPEQQGTESAFEILSEAKDRVDELAGTLDRNQTVQDVSTQILRPIALTAKLLAFPEFYWLAFALMVSGVVNYVFQLVPGKLVVLSQGSMNLREIISDSAGLVISAVGLILTTQAATENSAFSQSPAGVVSATVAGCIAGLVLYRWNQAEEVHAARGRRRKTRKGI